MRNANSLVTNANGLITSVAGNLNTTLDKTKLTISNANDVLTGLKEGRGPAGMLLRDEGARGSSQASRDKRQKCDKRVESRGGTGGHAYVRTSVQRPSRPSR